MFNIFVSYQYLLEMSSDACGWVPGSLVLENVPGNVHTQEDLLSLRDLVSEKRMLDPGMVVITAFKLIAKEGEHFEEVVCPFCHTATVSHVCPPKG